MGVSKKWTRFFNAQTKDYNYINTQYQRHDGLDCSGYVGWTIYNYQRIPKAENNGYVMSAKDMAWNYASRAAVEIYQAWQVREGLQAWRYQASSACSDCDMSGFQDW